jgi:hypothetical protein
MLWPAIETAQILRKTYGVSTFVARKLQSHRPGAEGSSAQ